MGRVHHFAREYDQAIEACRKTLELDPAFAGAHLGLGLACLQKSICDEAIAELRQALGRSKRHRGSAGVRPCPGG